MKEKKKHFVRLGRAILLLAGLAVTVGLSVGLNSAKASKSSAHYSHDDDDVRVTKRPTCGSTGMREYYCSQCGKLIRRETIKATGNHVYGDWTTVKSANCTDGGVQRRYCKNCDDYESRNISPWGHNSNGSKTVDPTCTEDGYTVKTCTNCGAIMSRTVHSQLGHSWGGWVTDSNPTCQKTGQRHHTCTRCGMGASEVLGKLNHNTSGGTKTVRATCTTDGYSVATCSMCKAESGSRTVIKATGHSMSSWVVDSSPTCQKTGQRHRTCGNCTYAESEVMAKLSHDTKGATKTVKATCTTDGYSVATCSMCKTESGSKTAIKATGHSMSGWTIDSKPSCQKTGQRHRTCANCNYAESEVMEKVSHDTKGATKTVKATCTTNGYSVATCSMCKAESGSKTVIKATGHSMSGWTIDSKPSCQKTGQRHRTCANCNYAESEVMSKVNHDQQGGTKTVNATCGKDGYTVATCSMCKAESGSKTVIKATGRHTFGSWVVVKNPTCTEYGSRYHTCSVCGYNASDNMNPIEHDQKGGTKTVNPTCGKDGYTVATCSMCHGEQGSKSVIPATGNHTWGKWNETKPASCKKTGTKQRACEVCGKTESGTIDELDHLVQGQKKTVPATCISDGYVVIVCSRCNEEMEGRQILPKTNNHDWGAWEVKTENTCEKDGIRLHVCKVCGKNVAEKIPKLGHSVQGQIVRVPATCVNNGYQVTKCSRCGVELGERRVLPATGVHTYGDWIIDKNVTCETDGYKHRVCSVCGSVEEKVDRKTGHLFEGQIRLINGRYVVVCTNCGKEGSEITFDRRTPTPVPGQGSGTSQNFEVWTLKVPMTKDWYDYWGVFLGFWQLSEREFLWKTDHNIGSVTFGVTGYQGQLHYNVVGNTKAGSDWVTVNIFQDDKNNTSVSIGVSWNGSDQPRSAHVIIFDDWGNSFVVEIEQYFDALSLAAGIDSGTQNVPSVVVADQDTKLIIDPDYMSISSDEFVGEVKVLNASGAVILVEYEGNTKDWITIKRVWNADTNSFSNAFTVTVKKNQYYSGRTGSIKFTDPTSGKYGWLSINQDYAPNPYTKVPEPYVLFNVSGIEVTNGEAYEYDHPTDYGYIFTKGSGELVIDIDGEIEGELHWIIDGDIPEDMIQIYYNDDKIIIDVLGNGGMIAAGALIYLYDDNNRCVSVYVMVGDAMLGEVVENIPGDAVNGAGAGNGGIDQIVKNGFRDAASKVDKSTKDAIENVRPK